MATIPVKDANGVVVPLEKPLIPGQTTMANSRPVVVASDQSAIPISGSVTISGTATISGTVAATQSGAWTVAQSGAWSVRNQDGSGNALTSATRGAQQALSVQIVDASGAQITSFGGSGGTASNFGSTFPATGTAIGASDGTNMVGLRVKPASTAALATDPSLVVAISPNSPVSISGTIATTQSGTWTVQQGTPPWLASINQGGVTAAVKAGSAAPVAGDPALVVAISPNSQNPNGQALMANSSPVVLASDHSTIPVTLLGSGITLPVSIAGTVVTNPTAAWDKGSGTIGSNTQRMVLATNQPSVPTIAGGSFYQTVAASSTGTVIQSSAGAVGDYLEQVLCIVATAATSQVMIGDGVAPATVILPNAVGAGVGTYPIPCGWKSKTGSWRITTAAGVSVIASGTFS